MLGQIFLIVCITTAKSLVFSLETEESAGDAQVVKGIVGQSASLPCHIDQENCGEVYFLTWNKRERDDRWTRIYVYTDNSRDVPLRDFSGRARLTLHKNESKLVINQLKNGDESLYKCDVTYVAGKCPSLTFVQLEIIAKPSKAYIEYRNSQVENGSKVSGVEGDLLRLACIVIGGKPTPVVSWRTIDNEGNTQIIEVKNTSFVDNVTTVIFTKELTRNDLNSKYECNVEHDAVKNNSMNSFVLIDVSVGAQSIEIVGPSDQIKEGDVAVMQCIAYSSKPETKIEWKNGSQIIDTNVRSEVEGNSDGLTINTRSYLELVVSRFDHLNTIECQAINIAMKQPISQSIELRIQYPPIVVMEPQNGLIVNESADTVNIYCTFTSNPPELIENSTLWYKDNELLPLNDTTHYISQPAGYPILTIVNPTRNDSGSYYCTLSNQIGVGKPEAPLLLNVLYPPTVNLQIYPNPSQGFTIKEGDDVRMICDIIDGNPLNASKVKWMKNSGESVNELEGELTAQKEITWLSISRSLTGNYTCLAISDAGSSQISNVVQIDVSYPPSKALIRQLNGIYAIKGKNLTLECIVSDLGKPSIDTDYHWENADGIPFESKGPILHITNLKLINRGNISCAAVNEIGFGPKGIFEIVPYAAPQIIDSLPPTIGVNEKRVKKVKEGVEEMEEAISVSCRVECYPICHINWYKNNELIENGSQFYHIKNSIHPEEFLLNRFVSIVSSLVFNLSALSPSLDRTSRSLYSCVSSDNVVGPSVKSEMQFLVEYPPENLRLKPKRVDITEFDIPPEILCESDALPPATYRWLSSSFMDKFIGVIADTPLLSLNRSIERDRAGTYTCIASNRHGEDRIDLLINVLYAPTCTIYESRTGKEEQDIVLICEVISANPNNDLTFSWFLNNSTLNETMSEEIVHSEGMKSKIIIPTVDDKLFGTWTCNVRNTVGESVPNCTLYVSAPIVQDWTPLGDESIILISLIIAAIIITFIVILLILICLMRRRRHKQESHQVSQTRENPDGSRSPTPSSVSSHLSSNQVITYKKVEMNPRLKRNDKVMDVSKNDIMGARKLPGNEHQPTQPTLPEGNREMYENMPFQRKNCMLLSGAFIPQSENIAQITRELRRTQSARFHKYQPFGLDNDEFLYADMYDDVKSGRVPDPRIKPPLPPKGDDGKAKPPKRPPKIKKAL